MGWCLHSPLLDPENKGEDPVKRAILTMILALLAMPVLGGTVTGSADCGGKCDSFVVYLEGGPAKAGTGEEAVVFDQKDKVFIPHVLPVVKGTTVNIKNGDPFLHNVHVYRGKDTVLNIALPFQGQVIPHRFEEAGRYDVGCDAHPEMSATIVVLENPYFAKPAPDGSYEIADVPAGKYTLVVHDLEEDKAARSPIVVD